MPVKIKNKMKKHHVEPHRARYAVHKKKSVFCPAGTRNCGQSGDRNLFFFPNLFIVW